MKAPCRELGHQPVLSAPSPSHPLPPPQVIMEAWVKGVNPKGNSTNPSNWDFGSSFFFAGTVVTTIGYGNLAPSTEAGQVFCVFYALVGIPLNVVFLNHLGTGLRAHLTTLERWEDQPRRSQLLRTLGLALFLSLGTVVVLIFPPMVFSHVEGWSFSEGFYFAFITLSTIGFGDYVVGTDPSKHYISVYRSLAAIWILLGLAWLALILPLGPLLLHRYRQRAQDAPEGRVSGRAAPSTLLLLLAYLAYLILGTGVFWMLESPAAHDSRERFQRDKWALLRNFTCLDGPALDSLIRCRDPTAPQILMVTTTSPPGHHPSLPKWGRHPRQHHQHGALGVRGFLLLLCVHHHHHWLRQPEPQHNGRPPLLHLLCSGGDPAQPRGAEPTGASHAAGGAPLRPQAGGHLEGPGQGPVAGRLQRPPVRPPAFPAAAPAALLPHGGLELRGGHLLRLHHPQHSGLRRLRDWDGPLPEIPAVVQEHSVPVDPLWDGMAGLDHQTDPLPAGGPTGLLFLLQSQLQGRRQAAKREAGPRWRGRSPLLTGRLLSRGAYGNRAAPRTLYSSLMLWKGQLAGCNTDMVAGALASMLHHEVEAMFEIGDMIR
ncbi:potassium channel subfamily K member 17 isoform X1 [Camelus ferus]|uniref:Potassium channel subfamily K member 17 isoform X1 n=1 Tax=Camelus ferus TaxID=419612 RepID=A0A8B8RM32_CAMFR|nr:potassium channel subfamily K member 17 isoform X1 [Camelus ferus]